ncbi:PEP-CTERM domain protein [Magnetospira sp. QH-2]|uniref:PEP-CTERM domain protein n=1 Tax=Magnetospira sp. (strain QH-2) TaxID=1288970 RepID=UPI0003E81AC1|nr:PEP-CTERM domain protein [Magnetospira sp. QH-2]CCQ73158.1 Exported protein of unknown function [Magnetospira sp. QH-2]
MTSRMLKAGAFLVFLFASAQNANATPITFDFSGAFFDSAFGGGTYAGETITGNFTVDVLDDTAPYLVFADPVNAPGFGAEIATDFNIHFGQSYSFGYQDVIPTSPGDQRGAFGIIAHDYAVDAPPELVFVTGIDDFGSMFQIFGDHDGVNVFFAGFDGSFGQGSLTSLLQRGVVPEPSALMMLLPALFGLVWLTRRRASTWA